MRFAGGPEALRDGLINMLVKLSPAIRAEASWEIGYELEEAIRGVQDAAGRRFYDPFRRHLLGFPVRWTDGRYVALLTKTGSVMAECSPWTGEADVNERAEGWPFSRAEQLAPIEYPPADPSIAVTKLEEVELSPLSVSQQPASTPDEKSAMERFFFGGK